MVIHMKSVLIGGIAALVIAIAAGAVMNSVNPSSSNTFATSNARVH